MHSVDKETQKSFTAHPGRQFPQRPHISAALRQNFLARLSFQGFFGRDGLWEHTECLPEDQDILLFSPSKDEARNVACSSLNKVRTQTPSACICPPLFYIRGCGRRRRRTRRKTVLTVGAGQREPAASVSALASHGLL